jgi:hypothetical protein
MPDPQAYPANSDIWNAYPPAAGDAKLQRGNFFLDSASVLPVTGKPGQANLFVEGSLPTPCNQPRVAINPPDQENRIVVEVYSVVDPNMICTQVLKPFTGQVAALAGYPAGKYSVVVNGMEAGSFDVP